MTQIVSFHISDDMAEAITLLTQLEDATVGEVMRDAVRRDLKQRAHHYAVQRRKLAKAMPPQALAG